MIEYKKVPSKGELVGTKKKNVCRKFVNQQILSNDG